MDEFPDTLKNIVFEYVYEDPEDVDEYGSVESLAGLFPQNKDGRLSETEQVTEMEPVVLEVEKSSNSKIVVGRQFSHNKRYPCLFCEYKLFPKLKDHFVAKHFEEEDVKKILAGDQTSFTLLKN